MEFQTFPDFPGEMFKFFFFGGGGGGGGRKMKQTLETCEVFLWFDLLAAPEAKGKGLDIFNLLFSPRN